MSTQVQIRRGNTAQTAIFTGAVAELTVDTDKEVVVVHDGVTAGGYPLARESALTSNQVFSQASFNTANGAFAAANSAGSYANSAFLIANSAAAYSNTVNNTQNTSITAAFTAANSAGSYANSAFATANNEAGVNLTQNTSITASFTAANSAGVYANGAFAAANTADNKATSAGVYANGAFTRANNSLNANTGGQISGDLSITGNLIVSGNVVSISTSQIVANDSLIILGNGNYVSDILDIGFSGHYNDGTNAHSGLIRDAGTKEWFLFKGYTPEVDANNNIIITDPSFKVDTLNANLKSTTITIKGIDLLPYVNNAYTAANTADNKATSAGVYANGAFVAANTADNKAASAGVYANGAFAAANAAQSTATQALIEISANTYLQEYINLTQNNNIIAAFTAANSAGVYANGAFDKANTDFTNITISPSQAYGNATHIPIVTVSANGRINAISTVAVTATDPSAIAFAIALG